MQKTESIRNLSAAMAKAQPEIAGRRVSRDSFWDVCRETLSKHRLVVSQTVELRDGKAHITTALSHESGEKI